MYSPFSRSFQCGLWKKQITAAVRKLPNNFEPQTRVVSQKFCATMSSDAHADIDLSDHIKSIPENHWVRAVKLVQQYNPVNLGQGFPDFQVPEVLSKALIDTQSGNNVPTNQYTRGQGNPRLVKALSALYSPLYNRTLDPMKNFLVTVGGYESLFCILGSIINPGDEVVIIEPFFDCYKPFVIQNGGIPKYVPLKLTPGATTSEGFYFDREEMENAFSDKTKAVIVNTPHNPTGKVFSLEEITFIADLCKKHNSLYISDEVYEWLVFQGKEHIRAASLPGMWERTVTVCSAGKTFNVTGWKIGWTIGPEYFIEAALKVHVDSIYTCATPLQEALAVMFEKEKDLIGTDDSYWKWLHDILIKKRDRMYEISKEAGFQPIMPEGGYFMVADLTKLAKTMFFMFYQAR